MSNTTENSATHRSTRLPDPVDLRFLIDSGLPPRDMLEMLAPDVEIPPESDNAMILRLIVSLFEQPKRDKLTQYNTLEDAVELIRKSKNIIVLSGAGISTSAGLPDFRSRDGIYKQIHEKHPGLRDPKLMFDIRYFRKNPQPFYHFAKALYPGQFKPTIVHQFIKCIEEHGKLLNNYTQNIDTLERQAGIKRVVECHGSFSEATCTSCKYTLDGDYLRKDIFNNRIPICPLCHTSDDGPQDGLGIMKPNIVFFGESLSSQFHDSLDADKNHVDLLIVIGSSLKVRPVALLPTVIPANVPQILINREPLDHFEFDIELYGNCDEIIQELSLRLGGNWASICLPETKPLTQLIGPNEVKISRASADQATKSSNKCSSNAGPSKKSELNQDKHAVESDQPKNSIMQTKLEKTGEKDNYGESSRSDRDSDWEDIEIVDSGQSTDEDDGSPKKLDFDVPDSSFIFVEPNKYLFTGVEMSPSQHEKKIKNSDVKSE